MALVLTVTIDSLDSIVSLGPSFTTAETNFMGSLSELLRMTAAGFFLSLPSFSTWSKNTVNSQQLYASHAQTHVHVCMIRLLHHDNH